MEVVRNIQLNLEVPEDAHSVLDATFEQFRQPTQHVADTGWNDDPTKIENTKNTLDKPIQKDEQTGLQASLVQSARDLATTRSAAAKTTSSKTLRGLANLSFEETLSCTTGSLHHSL
ncbi:MAG: hypothetical protein J07HQX50_01939 [Haloquadratum sp. J07HQX50]|jgi:transposase|nr:MAG: hypothetical protein J07HQX50_01939 [Haloquadratum sp. J07HQX50]